MPSKSEIKAAEKLFRKECAFVAGADVPNRIPEPKLFEIAFAGRSNVGKSSLINALTFRKSLARSSNTPGRTQQINFFDLGDTLCLVDLPGYGFAVASKSKSYDWNRMAKGYLCNRHTLKRVFVLVDSRRGLKDLDRNIMQMFDVEGVPYAIVLTKIDKVKKVEFDKVLADVEEELKLHPAAFPTALPTSSGKNIGIDELRVFINSSVF